MSRQKRRTRARKTALLEVINRAAPPHSEAAHRAISAELVRLTVRGRGPGRPELEFRQ